MCVCVSKYICVSLACCELLVYFVYGFWIRLAIMVAGAAATVGVSSSPAVIVIELLCAPLLLMQSGGVHLLQGFSGSALAADPSLRTVPTSATDRAVRLHCAWPP